MEMVPTTGQELAERTPAELAQHLSETLSDILKRHCKVFNKGLGTIKGFKADIKLQDDAKSVFFKARAVPYALPKKVEEELDHLESQGVVKKVERSTVTGLRLFFVCQRKTEVFPSVGISRCPLTGFF